MEHFETSYAQLENGQELDPDEWFDTHFCIVKVSVQARRILNLLIILQLHMRSFKRFYHNLAVSPGRILWKRDRSPDEKFLQVQDTVSLIEIVKRKTVKIKDDVFTSPILDASTCNKILEEFDRYTLYTI